MEEYPPKVPSDFARSIKLIYDDIHTIMKSIAKEKSTREINISILFEDIFNIWGVKSTRQGFWNVLVLRYFLRSTNTTVLGKEFIEHSACFLASVCLCDYTSFVQLVMSIYGKTGNSNMISLEGCRIMLKDALSCGQRTAAVGRLVAESYEKLLLYLASMPHIDVPLKSTISVIADKLQSRTLSAKTAASIFVPSYLVVNCLTKKYPTILWPLQMMHRQMRGILGGIPYWEAYGHGEFLPYLQSISTPHDLISWVAVVRRIFTASNRKIREKSKLASASSPTKSPQRLSQLKDVRPAPDQWRT